MSADTASTLTDLPRIVQHLRFLARLAGHRRIAVLCALIFASSLTDGIGLVLLVPITAAIAGGGPPSSLPGWLARLAEVPVPALLAVVTTVICLRAVIVFTTTELRRDTGLSITRRLRSQLQQAILRADWRWLSAQNSADQAALVVGEAARIGILADQALTIATGVAVAGVLAASAVYISPALSLLALVVGLAGSAVIALRKSREGREATAYVDLYTALQRLVSNGLTHLRAARIAGAEEALADEFRHTAESLEQSERRYNRTGAVSRLIMQIFAAIALALLVYAGVVAMKASLAILVPMLAILARMVPVIGYVHQGMQSWTFATPALDRVSATLDEAAAHAEPVATADIATPRLTREIRLSGTCLSFAGRARPVFDGFELTIPAGSIVAVVGPSGSGKSSLADMLCGLIAPDAGSIAVDGIALDEARRIAWRGRVAYVEQTPYLFDGTIAQNLAWGREGIGAEAIAGAVEAASAGFVHALPLGLATRVGEGGRQLSGGEKQRLALARALLRQPDLLILDEVTSALDRANEAEIVRTIARLRGRMTILLLTHNLSLLDIADQIVDLGAVDDTPLHG